MMRPDDLFRAARTESSYEDAVRTYELLERGPAHRGGPVEIGNPHGVFAALATLAGPHHPEDLERPLAAEAKALSLTNTHIESDALHFRARALAGVAAGLAGRGQNALAAESARSAAALDDLRRRSVVAPDREPAAGVCQEDPW